MERWKVWRLRLGWLVVGLALMLSAAQAEAPGLDAAERAAAAVDAGNAAQLAGVTPAHMTPETRAEARRRRGSGTPPGLVAGPDNRASQRAVCQAQCNLERQACDQGRAMPILKRLSHLEVILSVREAKGGGGNRRRRARAENAKPAGAGKAD